MKPIQTYRHPEWKRLEDALVPRLTEDVVFTYEELSEMAGINVRTNNGRAHLYRCRKEILKTYGYWLACVPTLGYRIIKNSEVGQSMYGDAKRGLRVFKRGVAKGVLCRKDNLTREQLDHRNHITSGMAMIVSQIKQQRTSIRKAAVIMASPHIPEIQQLLEPGEKS